MPDTNVVDVPVEPQDESALPNPVLKDIDLSKSAFNAAMAEAKGEEPVKAEETPEPVKDTPPIKVKKETPEEKPAEEPKQSLIDEILGDKKPEEPKVDNALAEIDAMVLPKNAKPEQIASFGKLKEAAKKQIEEKLARITELEAKSSDTSTKAEIEAAQARVKAAEDKAKELESTVERISFYESPKYKQFAADEEAQIAGAKSYLEGTEINPSIIEVAARSLGINRIRILKEAGADSDIISAVAPYLASFDTIQRAKTTALENWKTTSAQYAEEQTAQQEAQVAQRKASEEAAWELAITESRKALLPLRKVEGNEKWNERIPQLEARSKEVFNGDGLNAKAMAEVVTKGIAYDALWDWINTDVKTEMNNLRAENAKLKAAKPDGGASQGTNGAQTKEPTPQDRFNQELAKARA